jgi:hypothetical protein
MTDTDDGKLVHVGSLAALEESGRQALGFVAAEG